LHEPVVALARQGHLFDLTLSPGYWEALRHWLEDNGHWDAGFLGEKTEAYDFPLSFVQRSVGDDVLYRQYEQAIAGEDTGYCLGEVGDPSAIGEPGRCLGCGACTTPEERAAITQHTMQHPGRVTRELDETDARQAAPAAGVRAGPAALAGRRRRSRLDQRPVMRSLLARIRPGRHPALGAGGALHDAGERAALRRALRRDGDRAEGVGPLRAGARAWGDVELPEGASLSERLDRVRAGQL
jgi:hypothetical protein